MPLALNSVQCFAIVIIIFGFFGFLQGWRNALVLMGFTLAAVLFLFIGSAQGIATFIFVRIPQTVNILTGGAIGPKSPPPPSSTQVLISALLVLGLAMLLGFIIGGRAFPTATQAMERFLGIISGLVTGYAIISYVSRLFAANPTISVGVTTPSPTSIGNYIVVIVVIAVIALILGLLTARFGK